MNMDTQDPASQIDSPNSGSMAQQTTHDAPHEALQNRKSGFRRRALFLATCSLVLLGIFGATTRHPSLLKRPDEIPAQFDQSVIQASQRIDNAFEKHWANLQVPPAPKAPWHTIARRISLGLVGNGLSLEEYRTLESIPEPNRIAWWTEYLLSDRRSADHLAERLTRATVGSNNGPFLLYRRRKYVGWLADQFQENLPYDALVRKLITAKGSWIDSPEVNFLTATMDEGKPPDPIRLAGRTARAFLAMRIDCLQCHNDYLGNVQFPPSGTSPARTGLQSDFHQLAAFFSGVKMENPFSGLKNEPIPYHFKYLNTEEETLVTPDVPFNSTSNGEPWCSINQGSREELANWITHPKNRSFARAAVNRFWAILTGKPLVEPIDAIPIEGPFPPGLEELADEFIKHKFNIHHLIRIIVASEPFQIDSRSDSDPMHTESLESTSPIDENSWANFPISQLRPDQMAASVHQACRLKTIDASSSIISQLELFGGVNDFTKAYGDRGDEEFTEQSVTIPQRLLMMNGQFLSERIDNNPIMNAATRIASLARDDATAIETAFISTLNRPATSEEREHFLTRLNGTRGDERSRELGNLFWALLNSSEFQWNH